MPASDVIDHLRRARPADTVVTFGDPVVAGRHVAGTAGVPSVAGGDPVDRVAVLDTDSGQVVLADHESHGARWSPDGARLAWITPTGSGTTVVVSDGREPRSAREKRFDDVVESVRFAPDGRRLLLVVAEPGAQMSDVVGSGALPLRSEPGASWRPLVDTGATTTGWRRAWTWDLGSDAVTLVSPTDLTVWQAAWRGDDAVVLLASGGPTESDWYDASLAQVDLATGARHRLDVPAGQLAGLATDAAGVHVAVIVGPMSDRGIDVGALVVDGTVVGTAGVDVCGLEWTGSDELVLAGLRGLRTVVGRYRPSTGAVVEIWDSTATCGRQLPEIAAEGDTVVAWVHAYDRPPSLVALAPDGERTLWAPSGFPAAVGRHEPVQWSSTDGTVVEGVLVVPDGDGPHPLVVHVHGGPVWAWLDSWSMHYEYTPLLVGRGYAVLHPNHRAGCGRGAGFVHAGLRDLGGVDADDIVTGVDSLVAAGRVDAARVGVTGNSYGGFMTAWLLATSDRFAAGAARSPVTDWVSQHLTSNLPAFDKLCLTGPVLDPDADYRRRSPLYRADRITAPLLLMAGAHDLATPPEQAVMLHRALIELGRRSTLVVYPEEGHGVRSYDALVDQCTRLLDFFDAHLRT